MVHRVQTDGVTTSSSLLSSSGHPSERGKQRTMTRQGRDRPSSRCSRTDHPSEPVCQMEEDLPHYFHHDTEDRPCLSHGGSRLTCVPYPSRTLTHGGRWTMFRETGLELGRMADELERKRCRLHQMAEAGREIQKMADEFWIDVHPPLDSSTEDEDITVRMRKNS